MTALAADANLVTTEPRLFAFAVEDNQKIYKDSIVSVDSSGYARPGRDTSGDVGVGLAYEQVDNTVSGHTAGGKTIRVYGDRIVTIPASGMAQTSVGQLAYILDSATVALAGGTSNTIVIGLIVGYHSATSVDVWIPPVAGLAGLSGLSATATELNYVHSITLGTITASKVLSVDASSNVNTLLKLTAGLTVTGAAVSLNASSNFNVSISTGTTTGTVSIGNSAAGALVMASGAASSLTVTGASLTLQTLTSGAIVINSVGALTVTSGAASTWAMTGGLAISAGAIQFASASAGAYAATIALVVASNKVTIAGSNGTAAAFTLNCAAVAPAGQILVVETTADGTGTVTGTFGTHFRTTGTQATTLNKISEIYLIGDGTNWNEICRNTAMT